jgi:hypothetical protein
MLKMHSAVLTGKRTQNASDWYEYIAVRYVSKLFPLGRFAQVTDFQSVKPFQTVTSSAATHKEAERIC